MKLYFFSCVAMLALLCHCGVILAGVSSSDANCETGAGCDTRDLTHEDASHQEGEGGSSVGSAICEAGAECAICEAGAECDAATAAEDVKGSCLDAARSNGIGESYQSCDPPGTINRKSALDGCMARIHRPGYAAGYCTQNPPGCPCPDPADCGTWVMIGLVSASEEAVWDFGGPAKGHVVLTSVGGGRCPTIADPTWK